MITIIADPHAYQEPMFGALRASTPSDYVRVRMAVRRALDRSEHLTIHITNRLLLYWLEDLAEYEGVSWSHVSPEADFRRIFGYDPPAVLTADTLLALHVSGINSPPQGTEVDPVVWLLSENYGSVWASPFGHIAHLSQLLPWIIDNAERISPILYPLVQQRLAQWGKDHPAYSSLQPGSLVADATNLIRRAALDCYEMRWLHELGLAELPVISLTVQQDVWVDALNDCEPAIERYWRQQIAQSAPDAAFVRTAIQRMSGWSNTELGIIVALLQRNAYLLDHQIIATLRRRFNGLSLSLALIDELEAAVPPAKPTMPQTIWNDGQWLQWATQDYMPYFTWTIRTQQPREYQIACAQAYEAWLMKRYPDWLTDSDSPLITRQFTQLRELISNQPDALVVWLVVDGMTWWQGRILEDICRQQGLFPHRHEIGVSFLPSLTDISKRALVTGMPIVLPPNGSIAQAAREQLDRARLRGYVGYVGQKILEALQQSEQLQYVIWFANTLDRLAHERSEFGDDATIRGYLMDLAQNLRRISSVCREQGRPLHILVGSDHGSTLLPADAPLRRVPKATREVLDVWDEGTEQQAADFVSARAVVVADTSQPRNDQSDEWHCLSRVRYQLPQDYLIPRGYAAVGRRPSGWTHGGLTPEETIVPLIHLTPEAPIFYDLAVTISGQIRPRQGGALSVLLVNPNVTPLDTITLQIDDLPPIRIDRLQANERFETTIAVPARDIDGAELHMEWELSGISLGIDHRQRGETNINVRRLQTENDFEDLFG